MNPFIKNFCDLFSEDDNVVYHAILLKKNWMFKKLYFPVTFDCTIVDGKEMFYDLYALVDQSIKFKKIKLSDDIFINVDKEIKNKVEEVFNSKYRVAYCYEQIPNYLNDTFFVEMDFLKIDKQTYNELVANFYPCLDKVGDLDLHFDPNDSIDLLKYPMYGEYKKWVFILAIDKMIDDKFYLPLVKKIWYKKENFTQEKIETIEIIGEKLNVEVEAL